MTTPSALSPENVMFCNQVSEFCDQQRLTVRNLSNLVGGNRHKFGPSTALNLLKARYLTNEKVDALRPIIAATFVRLLEDRGYMPSEIEANLSHIFDPKEYMRMLANRCTLSPEVTRWFGLKTDPFDVDQLPYGEDVFTNPILDNVTSKLKDAVLYQRFVAVVGDVGTGKTLLKLRVAQELSSDTKAKLLYPEFFDMEELTVPNIANAILSELGQSTPRDKSQRVVKMKETLIQLQQEGVGVAMLIDEGHRLRDKVISSLKNFWEMTNGRNTRLLGIILFGQPSLVENRLRDVKFKEIRQRVQIIDMPPLNGSSRDYLGHRLQLAGGNIDDLFDAKAIDRICSNAVTPLALGNLANEALTDAFNQEERRVTVSLPFFKKLNVGQEVLATRRSAA